MLDRRGRSRDGTNTGQTAFIEHAEPPQERCHGPTYGVSSSVETSRSSAANKTVLTQQNIRVYQDCTSGSLGSLVSNKERGQYPAIATNEEVMRGLARDFQETYEHSHACIALEQDEWTEQLMCVNANRISDGSETVTETA